uniref:Uncharacterized protein n=1 Tax=Moniliophthora roreri TaxID=221103 RepID=A0A0W0FYZ8_MONRR
MVSTQSQLNPSPTLLARHSLCSRLTIPGPTLSEDSIFFHFIVTSSPSSRQDLLNGKKILWIGGNREVLQLADSIGNEPKEGSDMALALAQAAAEAAEAEAAATAEANVSAANPTPSDPAHSTQAT